MRSPTFRLPHRILRVSRFAVLQMSGAPRAMAGGRGGRVAPGSGFRVVDILAEGIEGDWTPAMHLQIMKVGRRGVGVSEWRRWQCVVKFDVGVSVLYTGIFFTVSSSSVLSVVLLSVWRWCR